MSQKHSNPPPTGVRPKPPPSPPPKLPSIASVEALIVEHARHSEACQIALTNLVRAKLYKETVGKDATYEALQEHAWEFAFKTLGVEQPIKKQI